MMGSRGRALVRPWRNVLSKKLQHAKRMELGNVPMVELGKRCWRLEIINAPNSRANCQEATSSLCKLRNPRTRSAR